MSSGDKVTESTQKEIRVAVVGCSHGELDIIFNEIRQRENDSKVDLLLCCGDFQAMRNDADLAHFHCPEKYKRLGDFHKYYSGEKEAPCLTIFIGGNHESSAFSMELPHGGWVAKNIYYMGFASVVNFGGIRIGGWSGIFKRHDYQMTHYECPPFKGGQQVSAYHVRSVDKFRLSLLADKKPNCVDLFMTHDWPVGITKFGNEEQLLRFKPYFKNDIAQNQLGNPHSRELVDEIRPRHWFAGHLHCKFEATVQHEVNENCEAEGQTDFLALHKCNRTKPNKMFFDIRTIQVDSSLSNELRYDPKWLAILKRTTEMEIAYCGYSKIPETKKDFFPNDEDLKEVDKLFDDDYTIPLNFRKTAPPQTAYKRDPNFFGAYYYRNPQTKEFCERLQILDLNKDLCAANMTVVGDPYYLTEEASTKVVRDEGEIVLDDAFGDDDFIVDTAPIKSRKCPVDDLNSDDDEIEEKKPRLDK